MVAQNISEGGKNLISSRVRKLREERGWSQSGLANLLQLNGCDVDKNIITRIETNKRHVTDMELKALVDVFAIDYEELMDGREDDDILGGTLR